MKNGVGILEHGYDYDFMNDYPPENIFLQQFYQLLPAPLSAKKLTIISLL